MFTQSAVMRTSSSQIGTFKIQALLHRGCYAQTLYTKAFAHRRSYTQYISPAKMRSFTCKRCYLQTILHTKALRHRRFSTQGFLYTYTFLQTRPFARKILSRATQHHKLHHATTTAIWHLFCAGGMPAPIQTNISRRT